MSYTSKMFMIFLMVTSFFAMQSCGSGEGKEKEPDGNHNAKGGELEKADALRESENYTQAREIYTEMIRLDSSNKSAYTGRAICILKTQGLPDYSQALIDLNRAIELGSSEKYNNRSDASEFRGIDHYYRGQYFYALASLPESIDDFTRCIELKYKTSECYVQRGIGRISNHEDIANGIEDFSKALEIEPGNHVALTNRGYYRSLMGDNRLALKDFDAAIANRPDDLESILNRGYTKINMDDQAGAIADFDLCLKINPAYTKAMKYKGVSLMKMETYGQAIALFDKVLAADPQDQKSFYYRGTSKIYHGDIPGGCSDLVSAIAMGNTDGVRLAEQYCKK